MAEKVDGAGKIPPVAQNAAVNPGDGIRSMRSSTLFRVTNFELYAKPNKIVMALGLIGITVSVGYLAYMKHKYEQMGLYTAVDSEGHQTLHKRESRWL